MDKKKFEKNKGGRTFQAEGIKCVHSHEGTRK